MESDLDEVINLAQAGNDKAFVELHTRFAWKVMTVARYYAPREAEDVSQHVWLCVARQLKRYNPRTASFEAWIGTIAHRKAITMLRKTMRRQELILTVGLQDCRQKTASLAKERCQPIDAMLLRELAAAVRRSTKSLPAREQEVFVRIRLHSASRHHVARDLGITEQAVRSTLCSATRKVLSWLGRNGFIEARNKCNSV